MKRSLALWLALGIVPGALGCGRVEQLEACDVLEASCQLDAYYAVVRMRGDGYDAFGGLPPIRTITLEEYRRSLEDPEPEDDEGEQADGDEMMEPPEDGRGRRERAFDTALGMLELLAPTTTSSQASVDDAVGNVVAFYSGATGEVTVIDRGGERNFDRETSTLVHELIHAFQGREPPISHSDGTVDDSFARRGLIEGEAELYEQLAVAEMADLAPQRFDWEGYYGEWIAGQRRGVADSTQPYFRVGRGFAYPLGGNRMIDAWLSGGNAAVRRVLQSRPRTSHYFMALGTGGERPVPRTSTCAAIAPSDELESVILDRFGAVQLYALLAVQFDDDAHAWEQALGWTGDALHVFANEEADTVALRWRILLDHPRRAELLADELNAAFEASSLGTPPDDAQDGDGGGDADEDADEEADEEAGEEAEAAGVNDDPLRADLVGTTRRAIAQERALVIHATNAPDLLEGWRGGLDCD